MLLSTNRNVAEESLARQPQLNNGKLQLAEKYRELSNLATTCWEKQSQLGEFEKVDEEEEGRGGVDVSGFIRGVCSRSLVNMAFLSGSEALESCHFSDNMTLFLTIVVVLFYLKDHRALLRFHVDFSDNKPKEKLEKNVAS